MYIPSRGGAPTMFISVNIVLEVGRVVLRFGFAGFCVEVTAEDNLCKQILKTSSLSSSAKFLFRSTLLRTSRRIKIR
jgi:hypothetical protein